MHGATKRDTITPPAIPLWTTSSRLLKLGESLHFRFHIPGGTQHGDLRIFSRYLERGRPVAVSMTEEDPGWLEHLPGERVRLTFARRRAAYTCTPARTGNYIAVWRTGAGTFYRYFSVIDDSYTVLSFSTFFNLDPEPTFHGLGIPLDYRLPAERFTADDALCRKLLDYNRRFGELVVPQLPDMPTASHAERVRTWGRLLEQAHALLPDPLDHRSARVDMQHNEDPGYPRALAELGIRDHCGLWEANCRPWLGMPEFLYYASPDDCRKTNQDAGGDVVAHQWDFCGSFHFLGPVDWHYGASEGRFDRTVRCMRDGMDEFRNAVAMSGHPVFVTPLYNGPDKSWGDNPNPLFHASDDRRGVRAFTERYLRFVAFELPREYPLVFTRSIDMVDYFRRHFRTTPRTVFSCRTDHVLYDAWWQGALNNYGVFYTPQRIPWNTRLSTVRRMRETPVLPDKTAFLPLKDPLSCEYILIEDRRRQLRFERECPNPVWMFDYTRKERTAAGSIINAVELPDVQVLRTQRFDKGKGLTITLMMKTRASFSGYAVALWGLPIDCRTPSKDIRTTARSYTLVINSGGETHMVLDFDLKPDMELTLVLRKPVATTWEW